jgi:hypothetical protein
MLGRNQMEALKFALILKMRLIRRIRHLVSYYSPCRNNMTLPVLYVSDVSCIKRTFNVKMILNHSRLNLNTGIQEADRVLNTHLLFQPGCQLHSLRRLTSLDRIFYPETNGWGLVTIKSNFSPALLIKRTNNYDGE